MKIEHIKRERGIGKIEKESEAKQRTDWAAKRGEMRRKEQKRGSERDRKGKRERKRGRVKRSWSGYETNSDLIWRVYDCFLFFSRQRDAGWN